MGDAAVETPSINIVIPFWRGREIFSIQRYAGKDAIGVLL
jgi:hypothetical protein